MKWHLFTIFVAMTTFVLGCSSEYTGSFEDSRQISVQNESGSSVTVQVGAQNYGSISDQSSSEFIEVGQSDLNVLVDGEVCTTLQAESDIQIKQRLIISQNQEETDIECTIVTTETPRIKLRS